MDQLVYVLDENNVHRPIREGEVPVDGYGNPAFLNDSSPFLQLVEQVNISPADGDMWHYSEQIWIKLGGSIYSFCEMEWVEFSSPSSSSMSSEGQVAGATIQRQFLIEDQSRHRTIREGDEPTAWDGAAIFINGTTGVFNFPEYLNSDPQNGQIWKYMGYLWSFIDGTLFVLSECTIP